MKHHGVAKSDGSVLLDRLTAIRSVQDQLGRSKVPGASSTDMVSRIHLYEILLSQISGIRSSLASGLEGARKLKH